VITQSTRGEMHGEFQVHAALLAPNGYLSLYLKAAV
jgi:hypothetical protein